MRKRKKVPGLSKFIFLLFIICCSTSNTLEILNNGNVKIKGLMFAYWDVDESDEEEIQFYLIPEDLKNFSGKAIKLLFLDDITMETQEFKEKKTQEIFQNIPSEFWKNEGRVEQPVILLLESIGYDEWGNKTEYFAKVKEVEKINKTKAAFKANDPYKLFDLLYGAVPYYYIASKDGYSALREKPDEKSKIKNKFENGTRIVKIMNIGNWSYVHSNGAYTNEEELEKLKGFVLNTQLKIEK